MRFVRMFETVACPECKGTGEIRIAPDTYLSCLSCAGTGTTVKGIGLVGVSDKLNKKVSSAVRDRIVKEAKILRLTAEERAHRGLAPHIQQMKSGAMN